MGAPLDIDKRSFKKMFPNLSKEFDGGETMVNIDSLRTDDNSAEMLLSDKFRHYNPTVLDFIRRCDTEVQAESIISYMEKRGEIDEEHAAQLRQQLRKEGLRSFGPRKEDDYYFKQSGLL